MNRSRIDKLRGLAERPVTVACLRFDRGFGSVYASGKIEGCELATIIDAHPAILENSIGVAIQTGASIPENFRVLRGDPPERG